MIEAPEQAVAASPSPATSDGPTAGTLLRQAREAAGPHVAAMAVALKVPVGKLEALERDRYDQLPDAVFARALASSVCRALKIDPRPVLDRLPQTATPRLIQDSDGLNAPFRSPRDNVSPAWREQLTRPVSLIVGALLLGAVAVLLIPRSHTDEAAAPVAASESPQKAAAAEAQPAGERVEPAPAAAAPSTASAPAGLVPASIAAQPAPVAPAEAPSKVAAASAAPAPLATASVATPAAAPAGAGDVVFRAKGESWIEVRDAKGAVPLRKTLAAGESASISGAMPLQVVVGNVNATEVDVHGKRFDLSLLARDNVARFQIK